VQLEVAKVKDVSASEAVTWTFLYDVARLTACIPNVSNLVAIEPERRYKAVVSDQIGPFKLSVPVQVTLDKVEEPHHITALLTGNDSRGQARVSGTLSADVEQLDTRGTRLTLRMQLEVLGKLAALGAAPMRRRADDIFSKFAQCVEKELGAA
jgi:carbon monoxide dehydrogenase subunit G